MAKRASALTAAQVARIKERDVQFEVRDGEVSGLLLRVFPTGAKRWGFRARQEGRLRFILIGGYPEISLKVARQEARKIRARLDKGERPADDRGERRRELTLGALFEDYQKRHRKAPRSATEDTRRWKRHLEQHWKDRRVSDLASSEIAHTLHRIAERSGPYESNRVLALVRHLYAWGAKVRVLSCPNPAAGLPREPEAQRERAIAATEMRKLLKAIAAEPDPLWQGYLLLLLLTGCRRTELLSARWEWLRTDRVPPLLVLPRTATKQKREHVVVLSSEAVQVLEQLPSRAKSAWLFPSDDSEGDGPRVEPKRVWARLLERAGLADLRIHDLRHAFGSSLGGAGENAFIIKRALGHSQLATTDRYVNLELEATRRAVEDHSARIRALRDDVGSEQRS